GPHVRGHGRRGDVLRQGREADGLEKGPGHHAARRLVLLVREQRGRPARAVALLRAQGKAESDAHRGGRPDALGRLDRIHQRRRRHDPRKNMEARTMNLRRPIVVFLCAGLLLPALLLAQTNPDPKLIEEAKKEGKLVVYAAYSAADANAFK